MGNEKAATITLSATDVAEQKVATVDDVPADSSIGELVAGLVAEMDLPSNDGSGQPLHYHALLEREGRHLHAAETVGDTLQEADRIVLQPNIYAG